MSLGFSQSALAASQGHTAVEVDAEKCVPTAYRHGLDGIIMMLVVAAVIVVAVVAVGDCCVLVRVGALHTAPAMSYHFVSLFLPLYGPHRSACGCAGGRAFRFIWRSTVQLGGSGGVFSLSLSLALSLSLSLSVLNWHIWSSTSVVLARRGGPSSRLSTCFSHAIAMLWPVVVVVPVRRQRRRRGVRSTGICSL